VGLFAPPDSGVQNLSSTPERPVVRYGSSNYGGEAMPGQMVAAPTLTPPSVMTPVTAASAPVLEPKGGLTGYYKQTQPMAGYGETASAFGTPIPSDAIQRYTFSGRPTSTPNAALIPPSTAPMELIVLNTGKEFAGRVVQRGVMWRIELPNGSVINMPGGRIATTRVAGSPAPTPQAL
jgi:hypothetical protein